jgi:hypothetical protein
MSEKDFVSYLYMLLSFELTVQSIFNSSQGRMVHSFIYYRTFYLLFCLFFTHPDETLVYLALLICNISFQNFKRFVGFSSY